VVLHISQKFEYRQLLPINETITCRTVIREHRTHPHAETVEIACDLTTEKSEWILTFIIGLMIRRNPPKAKCH
jgi:hypothetical protein